MRRCSRLVYRDLQDLPAPLSCQPAVRAFTLMSGLRSVWKVSRTHSLLQQALALDLPRPPGRRFLQSFSSVTQSGRSHKGSGFSSSLSRCFPTKAFTGSPRTSGSRSLARTAQGGSSSEWTMTARGDSLKGGTNTVRGAASSEVSGLSGLNQGKDPHPLQRNGSPLRAASVPARRARRGCGKGAKDRRSGG